MQVEVKGNIESAIRLFKRGLERDGILKEIKLRDQWPNKTDRKKWKVLIAGRRMKAERKRERRYV